MMLVLSILLALAPLMSLAACAPIRVLNAVEPKSRVEISHALAYGPEPRQMLDVYAPRHRRRGAPIVVFLYGGGWDSGGSGCDLCFIVRSMGPPLVKKQASVRGKLVSAALGIRHRD